MHIQSWLTLLAVASAAAYFLRGMVRDLRADGRCASGCGSCGAKACPARKLEDRLPRRA